VKRHAAQRLSWHATRRWIAKSLPGTVIRGANPEALAVSNLRRYLEEECLEPDEVRIIRVAKEYGPWRAVQSTAEPTTAQRKGSRRLCRVAGKKGTDQEKAFTIIVYTKEKP
jgi:hypothetical protein